MLLSAFCSFHNDAGSDEGIPWSQEKDTAGPGSPRHWDIFFLQGESCGQ